ncbi:uncharacterized protein LOC144636829 [Oculina patagonica]
MKKLILLVTLALFSKIVKGQNPPAPVGSVTCHDNHTVDISITNLDDLGGWTTIEWRLQNNLACDPTFGNRTVMYDGLALPDCAWSSEQLPNSIKYVLKISATKSDPGGTGQLIAYDHRYYVSCEYGNQNNTVASFVPIVNRNDNDSSSAFFRSTLYVFYDSNFTVPVSNPVALKTTLYFKATVETQSGASNLDLFPVHCWSSKNADPASTEGKFTLITDGCGNKAVSEDMYDTLSYACKSDSVEETFSIRTYRYFGAAEGDEVYFHCDLRVCLANVANTTCECPTVAECDPNARRRRSVADIVDESKVYHVSKGPFIFKNEDEEEEEEEEEDADETQSIPTNLVVTIAVSGVAALAIMCATAYLVVRSCNKRRQRGDLNVAA